MDFENISYTSSILWHFIKGKGKGDEERENDSLNCLSKKILLKGNKGVLLKRPRGALKYHSRRFTLESGLTFDSEDILRSDDYDLKEPRAICFADIPINYLTTHIRGYYGIGLGFKKSVLIEKISDLKPVDYYPNKNAFTLNYACKRKAISMSREMVLRDYAKIPTEDESFEKIYHEREWRTLERKFYFYPSDLACILFPTYHIRDKALKLKKVFRLIEGGVGYLVGEDLYTEKRNIK